MAVLNARDVGAADPAAPLGQLAVEPQSPLGDARLSSNQPPADSLDREAARSESEGDVAEVEVSDVVVTTQVAANDLGARVMSLPSLVQTPSMCSCVASSERSFRISVTVYVAIGSSLVAVFARSRSLPE
jgi:hypothetical protein